MRAVHAGQLGAPDPQYQGRTGGRRDRGDRRHGGGGRNDRRKTMTLDQQLIAEIAREVVARLQAQPGAAPAASLAPVVADGVFATVDDAVKAAAETQKRVSAMSLEDRGRIVAIIRRMCAENAR